MESEYTGHTRQIHNKLFRTAGINDDSGINRSYIRHLNDLIKDMATLVNAGHEIIWAKTENWCTVNGVVFNIPKEVWERRYRDDKILFYDNQSTNPYLKPNYNA